MIAHYEDTEAIQSFYAPPGAVSSLSFISISSSFELKVFGEVGKFKTTHS